MGFKCVVHKIIRIDVLGRFEKSEAVHAVFIHVKSDFLFHHPLDRFGNSLQFVNFGSRIK